MNFIVNKNYNWDMLEDYKSYFIHLTNNLNLYQWVFCKILCCCGRMTLFEHKAKKSWKKALFLILNWHDYDVSITMSPWQNFNFQVWQNIQLLLNFVELPKSIICSQTFFRQCKKKLYYPQIWKYASF